jgi:hypothetical protein
MRQATGAATHRRRIAVAAGAVLLLGVAAQTTSAAVDRGNSARALDGSETAHLHLVRQHEAVLTEEGSASGVLTGTMHAQLRVGSVFTGSFTIDTRHGSVTGHGSAKPHGTGRYQSFGGTLQVTSGTGRYAHIHGTTSLYGTFDRRTFDVIVQTHGRLSY